MIRASSFCEAQTPRHAMYQNETIDTHSVSLKRWVKHFLEDAAVLNRKAVIDNIKAVPGDLALPRPHPLADASR